jgi:hypothetical protein
MSEGREAMKFRTGLLIGLAAGYAVAKRSTLTEDDPYVVKGPQRELPSGIGANPAVRAVGERAQRLADQATVASLDAIRRTRAAIQNRLLEPPDDDAAWN